MGLASAPGLMQMVMESIARLITQRCPTVCAKVYLDDFLFTAPEPGVLLQIPDLLSSWGLRINHAKSHLTATRQLTYLGVHLDLAERRLFTSQCTQDQVLAALRALPTFPEHHAFRLARFLNFLR